MEERGKASPPQRSLHRDGLKKASLGRTRHPQAHCGRVPGELTMVELIVSELYDKLTLLELAVGELALLELIVGELEASSGRGELAIFELT